MEIVDEKKRYELKLVNENKSSTKLDRIFPSEKEAAEFAEDLINGEFVPAHFSAFEVEVLENLEKIQIEKVRTETVREMKPE